jgi:hypothetical protein
MYNIQQINVKTLTWGGGLQCTDANFPPLQSHAASQLPDFQAIVLIPFLSPPLFPPPCYHIHICNTIFRQVEGDIDTLELDCVRYRRDR